MRWRINGLETSVPLACVNPRVYSSLLGPATTVTGKSPQMAKNRSAEGASRSELIRHYMSQNPTQSAQEVVAGLKGQGTIVTPGLVYQIKHARSKAKKAAARKMKRRAKARRRAAQHSAATNAAPVRGAKADAIREVAFSNSLPPNSIFLGVPAKPISKFKETNACLQRLPKLYETVKLLEEKVDSLTKKAHVRRTAAKNNPKKRHA